SCANRDRWLKNGRGSGGSNFVLSKYDHFIYHIEAIDETIALKHFMLKSDIKVTCVINIIIVQACF
ncbi:MAG: hypothetical protein ABW185_25165, partial [Sedimenticola sp.]